MLASNRIAIKYEIDLPLMGISVREGAVPWTIREAVEGVQIFGGIGSGKTSGSGRTLALRYLEGGFGGLVLTAKSDEKALWQSYCDMTGRSDDLIVVEPGGKHHFNFLAYLSANRDQGVSLTQNIVQALNTVIRSRDTKESGGEDRFWDTAQQLLISNIIDLCRIAYGEVTVNLLYDIANSTPREAVATAAQNTAKPAGKDGKKEEPIPTAFEVAYRKAMANINAQIEKWAQKWSKKLIASIKNNHDFARAAAEALPDVRTMEATSKFFFNTFRKLAGKTRSIIDINLVGFLYGLMQEPTYSLFCRRKSNFQPEDSLTRKIILINLPVKLYDRVGEDCQILFKFIWQKAMERRKVSDNNRPVFLWADEAQHFLHEHDAVYQATARASRIATVYLTQNLPNYYASMGGASSDNRVKSFLGTLGTKIFHANADKETNEYASALIGEAYVEDRNSGSSVSKDGHSINQGTSYKLEKIMRPERFGLLKTGGPKNDFKVEAYIHIQGKELEPGKNFKKIRFNQNTEAHITNF